MVPLIHPRLNRKKVISRLVEECVYCGFIGLVLLSDCSRPDRVIHLAGAWVALMIMTVFGSYVGQLVRSECKDLQYVYLSLYKKIPDWVLWVFWPTCAAVLVNPVFALLAYICLVLATYRGFWFRCHCLGYRAVTGVDIAFRILAGFTVTCL